MKVSTTRKIGVLVAIVLFVGLIMPAGGAAAEEGGPVPDVQDLRDCVKVEEGDPVPGVSVDPNSCVVQPPG